MELIKADAGGEFCGDSPGIEVLRLRDISSATFVSLFCGSSQINLSHFLTLTEPLKKLELCIFTISLTIYSHHFIEIYIKKVRKNSN